MLCTYIILNRQVDVTALIYSQPYKAMADILAPELTTFHFCPHRRCNGIALADAWQFKPPG